MKEIFAIAIFLLIVPFTAFSMDLMEDRELDSVTGNAKGSAAVEELNADQEMGNVDDGSMDFITGKSIAADLNTDQESGNNIYGTPTGSGGVEIFIYDVSMDLDIMNISLGDTDGANLDTHR